jgi:hypothetical protein
LPRAASGRPFFFAGLEEKLEENSSIHSLCYKKWISQQNKAMR